jgi:DNA-binding CsgD family transcriptional regulator
MGLAVSQTDAADVRIPYADLERMLTNGAGHAGSAARPTVRGPAAPTLTARQRAVLGLVAEGHGNAGIARVLGCSEHTVKNTVYEVMARLGARSRAHAVARAVREGLI